MTITKDNTTSILRTGFAAIILLLLVVASYSLYRVNELTHLLINIVEVNDQKIALVNNLHDVVNNRWISLRRMVATNDPFERDDELLHFYSTAHRFEVVRNKLLKLPLSHQERELMQQLYARSRVAQPVIRIFVEDLASTGLPPKSPSLTDIKHFQDGVIETTDSLTKLIKSEALQAVESMRAELKRTYLITTVLTLTIILLAIMIARVVSHYVNKNNREIKNAMDVKSRFLANMSHEIRTPLTAIIGFAEHLLDPKLSRTEQQAAVDTIIRSGHHLQIIVDEILDLSKGEANKLVKHDTDVWLLDLISDVEETFSQQATKNGLLFEVNYQPPLPKRITSDPVKLKQILFNLCNNAIKFTEKGSIKLNIRYDMANQQIIFEVADDGIGIEKGELDKIFQPFVQVDASTTRRFGGTGLGLHLSQRFAELLGGHLTVESERGKGSCFTLALPTGHINTEEVVTDFSNRQRQPYSAVAENEYPLQGNVLLVEDTRDNQLLVSAFLKNTDIDLTIVSDGQQAISAAVQGDFDLILMDIQMPVMNGLQATQLLRDRGWHGPILALTANVLQEDCQRYMENGFNDVIGKPMNRRQLLEKISHYLQPSHEDTAPLIYPDLPEDVAELQPAIDHFVQQAENEVVQLQLSVSKNNWAELQQQLHRLKGSGAAVGFPMVTELARLAEQCVKDKNNIEARLQIHNLVEVLKRIRGHHTEHESIPSG